MNARRLLLVLLGLPALLGFSSASTFDLDAQLGGGGGYPFTGSPASHGLSCATCHQSTGHAQVLVTSTPPDLLDDGSYVPGVLYLIDVHLLDEQRGLDRNGGCDIGRAGCNRNVFAADVTDDAGQPSGLLCPPGLGAGDSACPSTSAEGATLIAGGHAIVGQSLQFPITCDAPDAVAGHCIDTAAMRQAGRSEADIGKVIKSQVSGRTHWRMAWRAPALDSGPVTLHVGVVDGDGGTTVDPAYADYFGDAVGLVTLRLQEAGNEERKPAPACSAAPAAGAPVSLLLLLCALFTMRRRPCAR